MSSRTLTALAETTVRPDLPAYTKVVSDDGTTQFYEPSGRWS